MRPNEAVIATAFHRLSPLRAEMPPSVNQPLRFARPRNNEDVARLSAAKPRSPAEALAISPDFALRNPGCFHLLCPLRRLVRRGDIGADHARFEFVDGHNVGCRERKYSQCGPMDIGRRQCALTDVRIIECSRRIRKERDLIIAEHGVACSCVTAVFRRRAGYDYGFDAPFPQYQIKVGREERAIAVFLMTCSPGAGARSL